MRGVRLKEKEETGAKLIEVRSQHGMGRRTVRERHTSDDDVAPKLHIGKLAVGNNGEFDGSSCYVIGFQHVPGKVVCPDAYAVDFRASEDGAAYALTDKEWLVDGRGRREGVGVGRGFWV